MRLRWLSGGADAVGGGHGGLLTLVGMMMAAYCSVRRGDWQARLAFGVSESFSRNPFSGIQKLFCPRSADFPERRYAVVKRRSVDRVAWMGWAMGRL